MVPRCWDGKMKKKTDGDVRTNKLGWRVVGAVVYVQKMPRSEATVAVVGLLCREKNSGNGVVCERQRKCSENFV